MRTTLIAALTVVSISAHAGVGDFFNDLFGGRFVNPSQVLSAGGDCDAIADTFINTPGRTYKWMGRGDQGRQFLEALDDNVTPDCARRLAYNYAAAIARKGQKDQRDGSERYQTSIRNLQRLLQLAEEDFDVDAYLQSTRACVTPPRREDGLNFLQRTVRSITNLVPGDPNRQSQSRCAPLVPGQVKIVNGTQGSITNRYGIRANPDGNHDILLNYSFSTVAGTTIPTPQQMEERTRNCFAEASPFLKGPDGKQLNLIMLSDADRGALRAANQPVPPQHKIRIVSTAERGSSGAYHDNFGCATIVHETLHVLGLCDEYNENDTSYRGRCRFVNLPNTIMNLDRAAYRDGLPRELTCPCGEACRNARNNPGLNRIYSAPGISDVLEPISRQYCRFATDVSRPQWIAANQIASAVKLSATSDATGVTFTEAMVRDGNPHENLNNMAYYDTWRCECNAATLNASQMEACQVEMGRIREAARTVTPRVSVRSCPQNALTVSERNLSEAPARVTDSVQGGQLIRRVPPISASLLAPSHYSRIINGLCENSATANYRSCADWAYKDSNCSARPAACQDPSFYLGLPQ